MNKLRLDQALVQKNLTATRSQAENYIKLGYVKVDDKVVNKPGAVVGEHNKIRLTISEQYVSRAALKLASAAEQLGLDFNGKVVLDVGSSTGGFTDYALRRGAKKVIAVDVGTDQMHPSLRNNPGVELHERTDIRNVKALSAQVDIVVIDVSFISLREILLNVAKLAGRNAQIVHKGVVKNDAMRRKILKSFEDWTKNSFKIMAKADSSVAGSKGNLERFYLMQSLQK
jgi:23S rRNA (cytidine1920-2'-O)/16S rRNA (cytidine1409-2'-O)-methyltransferase